MLTLLRDTTIIISEHVLVFPIHLIILVTNRGSIDEKVVEIF